MGIYITSTGLQTKTFAEIKEDLEDGFKEIFGENIDLEASSNFGQLIAKLANDKADLWDLAQEIYTARNPAEAIGTSLDYIVAENALERLDATYTTVEEVILQGDDATTIAAGKKLRQPDEPDTSIEFTLDSNVTIDKADARWGLISVTTVAAGDYKVTIDGTTYTYTAGGGESKVDILNDLQSSITAGTWAGTATVDTDNEQLQLQDDDTDFSFSITGNLDIDEVGSAGDFTCNTLGAITVPAESLTEIVTPVVGWNDARNYQAGTTGRDTETNEDLRIRREQSIAGIGNATEEAIRGNLLNDVDNITDVTIYSNRTASTDSESRPPHTFECVIEGGDDNDIAEKIWETQPAGINSYGNTTINITDSQGYTQVIKFSRSEPIYIFVRVKRSLYSEEDYPDDGDDLIKDAIVDWSLNTNNINVGKDVIRQRLSIPVYEIPGISSILIELDSSDTLPHVPVYSATNISIGDREKAEFAVSRIEVDTL
jgi:uncharacterized phage protein gp47/JayE